MNLLSKQIQLLTVKLFFSVGRYKKMLSFFFFDALQLLLSGNKDLILCALILFQQVISRWEEYMSKVRPKQGKKVEVIAVADFFPFCKYFSNAPQPVFKGRSYEEDMDIAEGCYRHIKKIFTQLEVRMSDTDIYTVHCSSSLDGHTTLGRHNEVTPVREARHFYL